MINVAINDELLRRMLHIKALNIQLGELLAIEGSKKTTRHEDAITYLLNELKHDSYMIITNIINLINEDDVDSSLTGLNKRN